MMERTNKKKPVTIVTTSVASFAMVAAFAAPMPTGTVGDGVYLKTPDPTVRYIENGFDFSTSSDSMMICRQIDNSVKTNKFVAYEMFGEMRGSTQEEKELYESMLARMSSPIDVDIFAL